MNFEQNPISVRFIEVFRLLKTQGAFKSQTEVSDKLDYHRGTLNEILKGKRDVTIDLLSKFFIAYDVNPLLIFSATSENKDEWYKKIEENKKKINRLYQRIIDVYTINSTIGFYVNFNETNAFADRRNIILDADYEKMSIDKLNEYNTMLESQINLFEEFFLEKFKDMFYNITTQKQVAKTSKNPLKHKK